MNTPFRLSGTLLAALFAACAGCGLIAPGRLLAAPQLDNIALPEGFSISLYASTVQDARSLCLGPKGLVFAGSRRAGKVYALIDSNRDNRVETVVVVAGNLDTPNGVAYHNGDLYVAETSRVIKYENIGEHLHDPPAPLVVSDAFPKDRWHGWKFIAFGPDGNLYVPVGAPCNVCKKKDERYASIMRLQPDGGKLEVFAHGVRNTVGFDWHPQTNELWFTDNGRDWLGDDRPPDELNHAAGPGLHFGFPYCHGKSISDPLYGRERQCGEFVKPELELGPHVAALGMRFYTGLMFPEKYRGNIFIAEHGSWNRTEKTGYRIMRVPMGLSGPGGYEVFASGWLQGEKAWGRPVDVLVMPDGSLLVSDDEAGAVYRITYQDAG
ncbi:sorbosone dehydrogenase family protein [candidate division FCPU426 bacterium]|nr:sorbosone dehydrogenase family protein [candidate division FCPU426 bacterium]